MYPSQEQQKEVPSTKDICRAMECRTTTVEEIIPLIFERTQTQFENLKTLRYNPDTLRLHQLYEQSTELEEINTELVKESIAFVTRKRN